MLNEGIVGRFSERFNFLYFRQCAVRCGFWGERSAWGHFEYELPGGNNWTYDKESKETPKDVENAMRVCTHRSKRPSFKRIVRLLHSKGF
jgi:hypothetical protein